MLCSSYLLEYQDNLFHTQAIRYDHVSVKDMKASDSWVFWGKYLCNTGRGFLFLIIISKYFIIAVFCSFICNIYLMGFLLGITGFVAQGPVLSKSILPSPLYFISLGFKVEGGHPHHQHLLEYYIQF